jgi:hypothetical protein
VIPTDGLRDGRFLLSPENAGERRTDIGWHCDFLRVRPQSSAPRMVPLRGHRV